MTLPGAARRRERGRAGVHGQLRLIREAFGARRLGDQLGRGQDAAAGKSEQGCGLGADEQCELPLELGCASRELAAAPDELAADLDLHRLLAAGEAASKALEPDAPVEAACREIECRLELVQVPAQALLDARALLDEVLAMVEQEPDLALRTGEAGRRQGGLAQVGTGDRERVDRSDLPRERQLRRAPAISLGGTRTTCSPEPIRKRSSETET